MARRRGGQRRGPVREERPPARVMPMLGLSLVLLVAGWTALWLFARHEAAAAFARWRAAERGFGRAWACPNQEIGGFPLGIVLTCDHPTFKGPVADGLFEGSLTGLRAEARLYFPTNVVVTLAGPLDAREVAGPRRLDARWSDAVLTLRGLLPANVDRGQLEMAGLDLGPPPAAAARVDRLTIGFKPVSRTPNTRIELESTIAAEGVRVPALDAALGSSEPAQLKFTGFATQVDFAGGLTLPELLDPWIAAGGQLHVESLDFAKGAFQAHAAGRLGLDDEHRLQGRLDTGFSGLDPVAARLGLPLGAVQVGGLLSGLLGGGAAAEAAPAAELTLPLVAKDGRLRLGPIDTGVGLLPLY